MKDARAIILKRQITEKGTELAANANKYLFKVAPAANKIEVKRAVEELFKVSVKKVNTLNYRGKKKRERTVRYGRRADWKRAVVTLNEGSSIDNA